MASKYAVYLVNFVSLMITARIFAPEVFGVIAAAQVFIVLFQLVAEGGLTPAVINLDRLREEDRDGIFSFSVLVGLGIALAFYLLGPALASFYQMKQLQDVVPYIALSVLFTTCGVLPTAQLQRQQRFLELAISGICAEVVALVVVVLAATSLSPLKAFALRGPVYASVNFIVSWRSTEGTDFGRARLGRKLSALRPLLRVTGYQLGFNFLNFFSRNLDNMLVGKVMGPSVLGIYDRSYQLMRYPLLLLTFAMTPAIQPALRSKAGDKAQVRAVHQDLTFKLSLLGCIAAVGMYFLAQPLVLTAFGRQWMQAVPILQLLSLIVPAQVVLSTSGSFYQVFNRTDLLFRCGLFSALTNVAAIAWGVSQGSVTDLCWALFVSFHVNFLQAYWVLHRQVFLSGFGAFMWRQIPAAGCVMALASRAALQ